MSKKSCVVKKCTRNRASKTGLCQLHLQRLKLNIPLDAKRGNPQPKGKCKIDGCENQVDVIKHKLCRFHYGRARQSIPMERPKNQKAAGKTCMLCKNPVLAKGLCSKHYGLQYIPKVA